MGNRKLMTLAGLALIFGTGEFAAADIINVPGDFGTIQAAIDAAQPGDIVEIADGMYTGPGNRNLDFGGKAITVRSASGNPTSCVLDCQRDGRGFNFHSGEGSNAIVEGLTVRNAVSSGVGCSGSSPTIRNCIIRNNINDAYGSGVNCDGYSSPNFVNCAIVGNYSPHRGGGIHCNNNSNPTFLNCTIAGNFAGSAGGGLYVRYYSNPTLTNCILWGNTPQAITLDGDFPSSPVVSYCDVQGGWTGAGNIDADPLLAFVDDGRLMPGSPCIDAGTNTPPGGLPSTDPDGNPRILDGDGDAVAIVDIGTYEFNPAAPSIALTPSQFEFSALEGGTNPPDQILSLRNCGGGTLNWEITGGPAWLSVAPFSGASNGEVDLLTLSADISGLPYGAYMAVLDVVDPQAVNSPRQVNITLYIGGATLNVPSQYTTIQAAIDAAFPGDEIIVADGTYTGSGNKNLVFYGKAITMRSASGDPALCTIDCQGNGRGLVFNRGEGPTSLVHGLTIANANSGWGAGIICQNNSSPTIVNCRMIDGWANGGAGAWVGLFDGVDSSHPTFTGCTFDSGYADISGGGVACWKGAMTLINCRIRGNYGLWGAGGVSVAYGDMTLINCMISGNSTGGIGYGGGIANDGYDNDVLIVNSTITDNTAGAFGGGISGPGTATNCIIWGNAPDQISTNYGSPATSYSDVQGGWAGTGNIDADPMFVDPDGPDDDPNTWDDNDYRLNGGSPCIDAGNSAAMPVDEWDLDGDGDTTERVPIDLQGLPRFVDDPETPDTGAGTPPLVDMGVYEYQPDCNTNGSPDACDIDCGTSGGPCDVPGCGQSQDCNDNLIPDDCEADTDGDGAIDDCDDDDDNDGVDDKSDPEPLNPDVCGDSDNDTCDDCSVGTDDFGPLPDNDPANDGSDMDKDGICDAGDPCPLDNPDDTDDDGVCDSDDGCPNDPNKTEPGQCGCGLPDDDSDDDGTADCIDGCPDDPNKIEPGVCGCGVADTDSDDDGTADCIDGCPDDPNKIEPGVCGCGVPDDDSDNDGTADCIDGCPDDPNKIDPGICGCGVPDDDSDDDGTADCIDGCPDDPNKIDPGVCGCGVPDDDSDDDGTPDCNDNCPKDPDKIEPGACGCGVPDDDSDNDGTADCIDGCPEDPNKIEPGVCGCGVADTDSDDDGTPDCNDGCPDDPNKIGPGICGCGVPDDDSDDDGTADCNDGCPEDPNKIEPGICGCGVADTDSDDDGTPDCIDNCPDHANADQANCDDDGSGDVCTMAECAGEPACSDCNENGIPDSCDIADGAEDLNGNGIPDECECPADFDGDGTVGASDLAQLLGSWGECAGCPADFDGDGDVDAADLASLLGSWGPCL